MRHLRSLLHASESQPSVVTIGAFDGVHRGHQSLIRRVVEKARSDSLTPIAMTFYPHPFMVVAGFKPGFYLTLPDVKAQLLGQYGIDLVITQPFDEATRHMRAAEFVERMLTQLRMTHLLIGPDFALGYKREGDISYLRALGQERGFVVDVAEFVADAGGDRISSSRIRAAISAGEVALAEDLLGRPYEVHGAVIQGAQRGRRIGIHTANVDPGPEQAVPANGVYAAYVVVEGRQLEALVNIGVRPTFGGLGEQAIIEAHVLDFAQDIYGVQIAVRFIARLRNELRFDGVEALVAQIQRDIEQGRALFAARS